MDMIISAASSNAGKLREKNEDNFFLNGKTLPLEATGTFTLTDETNENGLYAVCDGMGGGVYGEIASAIAADTLHDVYVRAEEQHEKLDELIVWYTREANARICFETEKNDGRRMGTTYVVVSIRSGIVRVYNLGDSRAYLLWGGGNKLSQLTRDHTRVRSLVDMGVITREKARTHPERHTLTQHLGIYPEEMVIEPYAAPSFNLMDGDVLLLCSDGLTDMLEDSKIRKIMSENQSPQETAGKLLEAALRNGGKDNITVVVIKRV